jgi:hypothetical protein
MSSASPRPRTQPYAKPHPKPRARTHVAAPPAGPLARWLADLGLGYVLMLAASIGGLVWLAAIHLVLMRHGPALMLSVLSGAGSLTGMCRARARAVAAARAERRSRESEVAR